MTTEPPEVFVRPTRYEVTAWPGPVDGVNRSHFVLYVEWRGNDGWCVSNGSFCYRRDGHSSYEPQPSSTDRFKRAYRFPLDEALEIAKRIAPKMTIGAGPDGMTAAETWEWEKQR